MGILCYNHTMLAAPPLLVPGEKPVELVKINKSHKMAPLDYWVLSNQYGYVNLARAHNKFTPTGTWDFVGNHAQTIGGQFWLNYLVSDLSFNGSIIGSSNTPFLLMVKFVTDPANERKAVISIGPSPNGDFIRLWGQSNLWYVYFDGQNYLDTVAANYGSIETLALRGSSDGYVHAYYNGVKYTSEDRGLWAGGTAADRIYLNSGYYRSDITSRKYTYHFVYWDVGKSYTDTDVTDLMQDPYQFLDGI